MKLWFRLTLVCWALVCLLLGLTQPVGVNHPAQVVGSGRWSDRCREPVYDATTVSVVRSMAFDPVRTASLESLVLDCTLTASNTGPPGQDALEPPEPVEFGELAVKAGSSKQAIEQASPRNYWLNPSNLKNRGFATRFS